MRLPEWCATHSFKDFLELLEEDKINLGHKDPEGKIMTNDNEKMATVELVSSEVSGYVGADGQFVHGEPPVKPTYVQTDEDVIAD